MGGRGRGLWGGWKSGEGGGAGRGERRRQKRRGMAEQGKGGEKRGGNRGGRGAGGAAQTYTPGLFEFKLPERLNSNLHARESRRGPGCAHICACPSQSDPPSLPPS